MLSRFSSGNRSERTGAQVTRRRRQVSRTRLGVLGRAGRRRRIIAAGATAVVLAGAGVTYAATGFDQNQVGTEYANGIQVSDNQIIKPLGDRLLTQFGKFMGSTVSPDGRFLAATSADKSVVLQIFDLSSYKLIWTVGSASGVNQNLSDGTVGQEGPTYSPDGKFLWLPERDGLTRFPVNADGTLGTPTTVPIPAVGSHYPREKVPPTEANSALVGKIAYSPDGSTLYAALNGQNTVVALDPNTGAVEHTWNVGIAPRELSFAGGKLYVSNEGGRQAQAGDTTLGSYGTQVPADGYLGTSTTGTVSVINTADPSAAVGSIAVGLHPTAMYQSGNALFVANTNSDTVSVIDTTTDQVVQTIETKPWPSSSVGYEPDGIDLTTDGHLLVTLGRANAVAVYRYDGTPKDPVSYTGLLPTDYYPAAVATAGDQIVVTNTRGIDARGPAITTDKGPGTVPVSGHDTHSTTASLTRFNLPSDRDIARYTRTVFAQNGWGRDRGRDDEGQARGHRARAVPVPRRIGARSTIKHVFLIVKENRTYDQLLGDIGEGNGDPTLTQFGEKATPNQHALATQFGLYDNTYDVGTNSAEGHNWLMQGDNPEYTESSAGLYQRSYDTEEDVLGHQRSGFLWTAVESAGASARNYGEFEYPEGKPPGTWQQYYCASRSVQNGGDPSQLTSPDLKGNYGSVIPSLNAIADPQSPPFDLSIPDMYRYQIWKQDFQRNGPANFNMIWLSSDHTGGPTTPEAGVADNDLATGDIVDTISHSKYWKNSAIFVVEDDSQDGADHVDGHRAPVQIISPWSLHGAVDSTYYSQINMVRTIEQILGAQPLNEKLAAATPMYDAFTRRPDYRPFNAVPNQIPLTEGIATPPACGVDTLGTSGAARAALVRSEVRNNAVPADETATAVAWRTWLAGQHLTGNGAVPDYANPEQMNRYTWYRAHDWKVPYPGDSRIYAPSKVPGAYIPSSETN